MGAWEHLWLVLSQNKTHDSVMVVTVQALRMYTSERYAKSASIMPLKKTPDAYSHTTIQKIKQQKSANNVEKKF